MKINVASAADRNDPRYVVSWLLSGCFIVSSILVEMMTKLGLTPAEEAASRSFAHDDGQRDAEVTKLAMQFYASFEPRIGSSSAVPNALGFDDALLVFAVVSLVVGGLVEHDAPPSLSLKNRLTETMEQSKDEDIVQSPWRHGVAYCFKANSSILNSLLTIINERAFDNDGQRIKVPLVTMFGASNELPEGAELEALFDRFLFRYWIPYVADRNNLAKMLKAQDPQSKIMMSLDEVRACQQEAAAIPIDDAVLGVLLDVKERVERAGVRASDRRWKRAIRAMQAFAYLQGDAAVNEDHFEILPDLLWREPKERAALVQEVGKVANPIVAKISEIMDAATECVRNLPADTVGRAKFLAEAAEAIATLDQMTSEISRLKVEHPGKGKRLDGALAQLNDMRDKTQRRAAAAAGIRM